MAVIALLLFATLAISQQNNSLKEVSVTAQETEISNSSGPVTNTPERIMDALGYYWSKSLLDLKDLETMIKILDCESSFKHDNVYGDHGKAYGVAQFHKPTFNRFCSGDYYNMENQVACFVNMYKNGLANHWSCNP